MKKGLLFVLSGSSGSGKGTVLNEVLKQRQLFLSISATSRESRTGEADGVNYYFLSRGEFQEMVDSGQFLEHTETYGNYYGTPKQPILDAIEAGKDIMLEIDLVGAINVKSSYPEAVLIFLAPPTIEELKRRLIKRGTETEEQIESRISYYVKEMNSVSLYDYVVVNDKVKNAADDILNIIDAEHLKVKNNTNFISNLIGGMEK